MDQIDELLTKGVDKIYPNKEEFEKLLRSGKKIRLYQGFDPSMPNLHLGNFVGLMKLKQFQDLGHEVIFLVGDFTGMIGDPTDKSAVRKQLTRKQVLENAKNWHQQAGKILNFEGKNPAKIMFNSQWGDKVSFKDLIEITSNFTVQQMLERDFFQERLKTNKPIYLHEFLYPVAQAIDCVEMNVDLEIGGSDQTFNMLCGRTLMKALKGKEKFVLTTKLLVDGQGLKVGKTTGNALFLNQKPEEMFGSVMSFPDEVMILSFELLTNYTTEQINRLNSDFKSGKIAPIDLKKLLATEIVTLIHSEKKALAAQTNFETVVQNRGLPIEAHEFQIPTGKISLVDLLFESNCVSSKSEAKRLLVQKAIEINGQTIIEFEPLEIKDGSIIKIGKHQYLKVITK